MKVLKQSAQKSCLDTGYALSKISRMDIYGTCNDPTLLEYVGSCESAEAGNCSDGDRQSTLPLFAVNYLVKSSYLADPPLDIAARASTDCALVGGIASTVYTYRFPGLPACAVRDFLYHPRFLFLSRYSSISCSSLRSPQNDCTSSALRFSDCQGDYTTCPCKDPAFANAFGPCYQTVCSASDIDGMPS